jgi:hypothetical protein
MSTPELSGLWTYRSFNPRYVTGGDPEREHELILAEADLNVEHRTSPTTLEGTIDWRTGPRPEEKDGLDLEGKVLEGELRGLEIVGTGRPRTGTAGWEYRYHGHLLPSVAGLPATIVADRPILGGSVFRAKSHNGNPPRSQAGSVYPFIAVWKQPFLPPPGQPFLTSEFAGLWTYRSFRNDRTTPVYKTAPQNADELILQEAVFTFRTPTSTTLEGTIEWPGRFLKLQGAVRLFDPPPTGGGGESVGFQIVGSSPGTDTAGWEYHYRGYLTRHWPNGVDQRPALVGIVARAKPNGEAAPAVAPFIAVKQ